MWKKVEQLVKRVEDVVGRLEHSVGQLAKSAEPSRVSPPQFKGIYLFVDTLEVDEGWLWSCRTVVPGRPSPSNAAYIQGGNRTRATLTAIYSGLSFCQFIQEAQDGITVVITNPTMLDVIARGIASSDPDIVQLSIQINRYMLDKPIKFVNIPRKENSILLGMREQLEERRTQIEEALCSQSQDSESSQKNVK